MQNLPQEMLQQIVQHVANRDIWNLYTCCKLWYAFVRKNDALVFLHRLQQVNRTVQNNYQSYREAFFKYLYGKYDFSSAIATVEKQSSATLGIFIIQTILINGSDKAGKSCLFNALGKKEALTSETMEYIATIGVEFVW